MVRVAGKGWTRPPPARVGDQLTTRAGSAVLTIAIRTSSTDQVECACSASAATPATCGAAIDVPEIVRAPLPVPMPVEVMLTPGAVMSGLRRPATRVTPPSSKPDRGPLELNDAIWLAVGLVTPFAVAVADVEFFRAMASALRVVELTPRMPNMGMVTSTGVSPA